jgi:predicted nuclease with TOPRIM domain
MGIESILQLISTYGILPIFLAGIAYFGYKYIPNLIKEVRQANENSVKLVILSERISAIEEENKDLKKEYKELEAKYTHQGEELGELKTAYAVLKERFENLQDRFEDKVTQSRGRKIA